MNQNRCSSSSSSSSNRDHPQEKMALHQFSTLITTCSSDQALIITMPQPHNSISESSNSTSSSHAASKDALVSTAEIIVNDQLPPSPQYSQMLLEMSRRSNTCFNSTSSCSYITQFINLGVPDSKNSIRSFQSVDNGSAILDEKAPELFNSQFNPRIVRNDLCSSRVSTNSAFEKALVPSLELKLRKLLLNSSAHETTELFADAHEENLGSNRIPDTTNASSNGSNSRKRKEISRGKADLPPAVKNGIGDEKSGVKLSENSNFQRRSTTRDASNDQYVHVRARRGQATDSHSLAERVRREKINKRMKLLQDLVPGCDKITGKAVMLDEIINYVQSLQHQVQFLSMKLATVSPSLEFNVQALPSDNMLRSIHPVDRSRPIMGECLEAATSRVHMVRDDDDEVQGLLERRFGKMKIQEMKFSSQCSYVPYIKANALEQARDEKYIEFRSPLLNSPA